MDVNLGIAGLICVALAIGHTALGIRWVLPGLSEESVPATPFGPRAMTLAMLRVTWYIVTIFVLTAGLVLCALGFFDVANPGGFALRGFALMWVAAVVMAEGMAFRRGRFREALRLPVPLLWLVVAILSWAASV